MKQYFFPRSLLALGLILIFSGASAQWVQTNGPLGGSVGPFAVSGNKVFAGTTNGIFSSADHGLSWIKSAQLQGNRYVTAMASLADAVFAAADSVYRTTDNGTSWQNITNGLPADYHYALLTIDNTVFIQEIYANTFYSSIDKGASWKVVKKGWAAGEQLQASAAMGKYLFAATDVSLYRSSDNGLTWSKTMDSLPKSVNVIALGAVGSRLFASTNFGVFVSLDSGKLWSPSAQGLPAGQYLLSFTNIGTVIFAASHDNGVFASTDLGQSWVSVSKGLATVDARYGFAVMDTDLLVGTDIGVFRATKTSDKWTFSNSGIVNYTPVSAFAKTAEGLAVSTRGRGIYLTFTDGDQWVPSNTGLSRDGRFVSELINLIEYKGALFTASTYEGSVFRSTNGGSNWTDLFPGRTINSSDIFTVGGTKVFINLTDSLSLNNIFYSDGDLKLWSQIYPGSQSIFAFAEMGSSLFAASSYGLVFRSTDGGSHWKIVNIPNLTSYVLSLAVIGNTLFAGTQDGAFVSTDEGASWKEISAGLTDKNVSKLLAVGTNLFALTLDGVFLTKDNGANWINVSNGLPAGAPLSVLYASPTYLFAGVNFKGVWKRPLSEMIN